MKFLLSKRVWISIAILAFVGSTILGSFSSVVHADPNTVDAPRWINRSQIEYKGDVYTDSYTWDENNN